MILSIYMEQKKTAIVTVYKMRYVPKIFPLPFSWYLTKHTHQRIFIVDLIWIVSELRYILCWQWNTNWFNATKLCVCVLVKWIVSDCSFCSFYTHTHRILQISILKMRVRYKCTSKAKLEKSDINAIIVWWCLCLSSKGKLCR